MFSPHSRSESGCKQICWTISHVSDRSVAVLAEDETQYCSRLHIFRASFWYLSLPPTFWRYVYNVCWQCSFKIIAQPGVPRDTFLIRQLEDKNDCQNMSERRPACLLGPPSFLCSCLCKQGQGLLYLQGRLITPKSFHPYVKSTGSTVQYSDCRVQCAHLVWCHGTVGNGGLEDICPNLGNVLWRRVDGCVALCFVKLYENIPLHNRIPQNSSEALGPLFAWKATCNGCFWCIETCGAHHFQDWVGKGVQKMEKVPSKHIQRCGFKTERVSKSEVYWWPS